MVYISEKLVLKLFTTGASIVVLQVKLASHVGAYSSAGCPASDSAPAVVPEKVTKDGLSV